MALESQICELGAVNGNCFSHGSKELAALAKKVCLAALT
jgi:hypothetical protein